MGRGRGSRGRGAAARAILAAGQDHASNKEPDEVIRRRGR